MKYYYDLEINILSCIVQNPKLMETTILKDEHFIKHKRFWLFMKSFYQKFKTFDLVLMYQKVKNKYQYIEYARWLMEVFPDSKKFKDYELELIELFHKKEEEKTLINKLDILNNELVVGNIEIPEYKKQIINLLEKY